MELTEFLSKAYTAYHAVNLSVIMLKAAGFTELDEAKPYKIERGGKYYVISGGSSLAAFTVGNADNYRYKIAASHTDSPAFKVKYGGDTPSCGCVVLETESYGGAINYSWFDRPLKLAGRACYNDGNAVKTELYESGFNVVIPSVAAHMNREVNKSFSVNVQTDIKPIFSLGGDKGDFYKLLGGALDCDIYAVCDQKPFYYGKNGELLCSPRIDNLTSVYTSVKALTQAGATDGVNVAVLFDSEEIGSSTAEGACSTFLKRTLERINASLGFTQEDFYAALARSFMLSVDNAHAAHPNHPELSSPEHKALLGGGVTVKHHGNRNYVTDGYSSAAVKAVFDNAGVKYQDFYMRSDMPCGRTLGALLLGGVTVKGADIGVAQLAMHSAVETAAVADIDEMQKGLTAFFTSDFRF